MAVSEVRVTGWAGRTVTVGVAVAVAATVCGSVLMLVADGVPDAFGWALAGSCVHALVLVAAGGLLARRSSAAVIGRILLGAGGALGAGSLCEGYATAAMAWGWPGAAWAAWPTGWLWALCLMPLLTMLPALFPDGRPTGPKWRFVVPVSWAATAAVAVAAALRPGPLVEHPRRAQVVLRNPLALPPGVAEPLVTAAGVFAVGAVCAAFASLFVRWRRARAEERRQLKWLVFAVVSAMCVEALNGLLPHHVAQAGFFLIPVMLTGAISVAVLRLRLYDIDVIIHRTRVSLALTAVVYTGYLAMAAASGLLVGGTPSPLGALAAAAVIACVADPARRHLQRAASRLVYGRRDEPLRALQELRGRLHTAVTPAQVAAVAVDVTARSVRAPGAAVHLYEHGPRSDTSGPQAASRLDLPLVHRTELLGHLSVRLRSPGEAYRPKDLALLAEITHLVATAVHNARLREDLVRAHDRLVRAEATDRERLRRDLHDGLGPLLSGTGLLLEGAAALAPDDTLARSLAAAGAQLHRATREVRRVIDSLGPASLTELGLCEGIRDHLRRLSASPAAPRLELRCQDVPEELPPAVAEAAYLVVLEAVTNAVRHARARTLRVSLSGVAGADGGGRVARSAWSGNSRTVGCLCVDIRDDGLGFGAHYVAGVGIASMRMRATELGGEFAVLPGDGGGTHVRARFPLAAREDPG